MTTANVLDSTQLGLEGSDLSDATRLIHFKEPTFTGTYTSTCLDSFVYDKGVEVKWGADAAIMIGEREDINCSECD